MTALRSLFGCGWVLGGHHPDIHSDSQSISTSAITMKCAKLLVRPEPSRTPEFWEAEDMGVLPPPRCEIKKILNLFLILLSQSHYSIENGYDLP